MIDYIAEIGDIRVHLSNTGQIKKYLKEGYKIYRSEDRKETLIALPEAGYVMGQDNGKEK